MSKGPRRLWLKIRGGGGGYSNEKVVNALMDSIRRGDYDYKKTIPNANIGIGWSNRENGKLQWGEFQKEMTKSAASSQGFDAAVMQYLESLL